MITIHGVPISVHVRKVLVTASLKQIAYRLEPVIPFNPPANWPKLSPTGLIPVMDDDGFLLRDYEAICQYLERKQPTPAVLPATPQALGRALWFEAYAGDVMFRRLVHDLFFQKVIRPGILKETTDQSVIETILQTVQPQVFAYLESEISGDFLVGDALSVADIAVVSNLINYQYLGFGLDAAAYPRLAAYARRLIALPLFQQVLAAEQPFAEQMGLDRSFVKERVDA